jgi:hypothetical protein
VVEVRLVVVLVVAAATLAGCTEPAAGDSDAPVLEAGRGAIAGLLVDDRYRPLRLTDMPAGEFEARGFILVVETGRQLQTASDGTFTVLDLEPGTYTLRPSVQGHEGSPTKVDVAAGLFTEVDLLVRRLISPAADSVVVHDDTVLITCSVQVLDGHFTIGRLCHGDLSGEPGTNWVDYNYTGLPPIVAIVVEAQPARTVDFEVWLTKQTNLIGSEELYGKHYGYDSSYLRIAALDGTETGRYGGAMLNTSDLRAWVNVNGPGTQEADALTGLPIGADFTFVLEVRLVVSAFFSVPPDFDTYAILA